MPLEHALVRNAEPTADLEHCRRALAEGSLSFAAAARMLPARVRAPVTIVYAYCRAADDAIDLGVEPELALRGLRRQLDRLFSGRPHDDPIERALAHVIAMHELPRAPFDLLLDGFRWDSTGHPIRDDGDLVEYAVRVASTVGVLTTMLMGVRDPSVLARACELGIAMQLTNIARDVGEDARAGRVYLPQTWLADEGLAPDDVRSARSFDPAIGRVVRRLLDRADELYRSAGVGIAALPEDCRGSIRAAAWIYADIGTRIRARGYDSITARARTSWWRKLVLAWRARRAREVFDPLALARPVLPEVARLVDACGVS